MIATVPVTTNGGKTHLVIGLHLDAIKLLISGKVLQVVLDPTILTAEVLARVQGLEFLASSGSLTDRIMQIAQHPELAEWIVLQPKLDVVENVN